MASAGAVSSVAFETGQAKKRNNAISAMLSGFVPAILLICLIPGVARHWLLGFCIGLVWANGFEYAYHRWLLHRPRSSFGKGHLLHHSTVGQPDEREHVTLGSSAVNIAILFLSHGIVLLAGDAILRLGVTPGVLAGWTTYLIAAEEIHWRIHLGERLPVVLRWSRAYHFTHHDCPNARYNVFFPLFDFIFGSFELGNAGKKIAQAEPNTERAAPFPLKQRAKRKLGGA
jgi:hypothetical protein